MSKNLINLCLLSFFIVVIGPETGIFAAGFTDGHGDNVVTTGGAGWTVASGTWKEAGGLVSMSTVGRLLSNYACKSQGRFFVRYNNGLQAGAAKYAGILFRYTDDTHCYYLLIDEPAYEKSVIYLLKNQVDNNVASAVYQSAQLNDIGNNDVEVRLVADSISIYFNGALVTTYVDNASPNLTGKVGYACGSNQIWSDAVSFDTCAWYEISAGPPIITADPQSKTVAVGSSVSFSVAVYADPSDTTFKWQEKGSGTWQNITAQTTSRYTIASAQLADEDSFRVVATNSLGSDTSKSAGLKVYAPATITDDPDNVTANINVNVSFTVAAGGTAPLSYQWQIDSNTGVWKAITGATTTTHTFTSTATAHDNFKFRCIVTGYLSSKDTSAAAVLRIIAKAVISADPLSPREVNEGDSVIFQVVAGGEPAPSYQWQKYNGLTWNPVGTNSNTYAIDPVAASDEGTYRVRVWNVISAVTYADTSTDVVLTICQYPHIIAEPVNDTVLVGQSASFKVTATGKPLTYIWQKLTGTAISTITGAITNTCSFITTGADAGTYYRCLVSACDSTDTSMYAGLILGSIPTPGNQFSSDTVLARGSALTLTGTVTAIPAPQIEWFFIPPGSITPVLKGTGKSLQLSNLTKADSGSYYFVASNKFGSGGSDSLKVHVLEPVTIEIDLPASYQVIHGGEVLLKPEVKGDGLIQFQWYENATVISGQTSNLFEINPVDSAIHNGKKYSCVINNSFLGTTVSTVTTAITTIVVGKYYNPFKIKAERVNIHTTDSVRIKLWGNTDISNFPSKPTLFPWADSIWVFYKTFAFSADPAQAVVVMFSTDAVKQAPTDTLVKTIAVQELKPGGNSPFSHDSCYWFSSTVLWHTPGSADTLLRPFANANKLYMLDSLAPQNPLVVYGEYIKTDTIKLVIDSLKKMNILTDSLVVVQCSKQPQFGSFLFSDTLSVKSLLITGDSTIIIHKDTADHFPIASKTGLDTIYCRWFIYGTNGVGGVKENTSVIIGWQRPVFGGILHADSTKRSDQLHIDWSGLTGQVDSIRVWWDTVAIPLDKFNITLSPTQAHKVNPTTLTIDTVENLTGNTVYYLALQIYKDQMWSLTTAAGSSSAKTISWDLNLLVDNVIAIDSTWFNDTTNSMVIQWHVDNSTAPSGAIYKYGYSFSIDSSFVTTKPISMDSVKQDYNITKIPLFPSIVFDTSYHVGLWLSGYNEKLGLGKPDEPTDSSSVRVAIPSFTWQYVTIFPANTDNVFAANNRIIFNKLTPFTITDTLRAFKLSSLPPGFVYAGGTNFRFGNKNLQIAPILLGMKYDALPAGISENKMAVYSYKNNQLEVRHGFWISNGAVWDTIRIEDIANPFVILADTSTPEIKALPYNDTAVAGTNISTKFDISDNCGNVRWQLLYGPGDKSYIYGETGILETVADTLTAIIKDINNQVINSSFGVRALCIATDGVNSDTVNISRCVRTPQVEVMSVNALEWTPMRVAAVLDSPSLDFVFNSSIDGVKPWEYDVYNYRLYRWYSLDSTIQNDWLEYGKNTKKEFDFVPGRLIWYKSANSHSISFGPGVTTSLKQPCEIVLRPKNWTDISMPYQFPVMLRDVLEASGTTVSDSIEVYQWRKAAKNYEVFDLYIAAMDSIQGVTDTLISAQKRDAYTVYNHSSRPVSLVIPPICLALSKYADEPRALQANTADKWDVHFNWTIENESDDPFYRRVRCGYAEHVLDDRYGILPPSMSNVEVGVVNKADNTVHGWTLQNELDTKDGICFTIDMGNYRKTGITLLCHLANLTSLPKNYMAGVLNPSSHSFEAGSNDSNITVSLGTNDRAQRIVAIGTASYFDNLMAAFLPAKLLKAFPNPFAGKINIHFRLPAGIRDVRFTLYNLQGQELWQGIDRNNVSAGEHVYRFSGTNKQGSPLPAGVYIMRMSVRNSAGKCILGGEKRITCLK